MIFTETKLKGAFVLELERHEDDRGYFARTFCQRELADHGLSPLIAQSSVAFNRTRGIVRGMHFSPPSARETKVVRVTRGAVLDVIIDLRPESPTWLQHVAIELSAENGRAVYVPNRFAHGYQVLEDGTETSYQIGAFYEPEGQCGLRHDDPRLGLKWPLPVTGLSSKDQAWPLLDAGETKLKWLLADRAGLRGIS
jgi:dTDP-4-dehydrorhamnose 3,5-epimerase